jgi:hypothetical protein
MIVQIVIDAVSPGIAPAVLLESVFEHRSRIERRGTFHGIAVDDDRPARVIGHHAVILEAKEARLPLADQLI